MSFLRKDKSRLGLRLGSLQIGDLGRAGRGAKGAEPGRESRKPLRDEQDDDEPRKRDKFSEKLEKFSEKVKADKVSDKLRHVDKTPSVLLLSLNDDERPHNHRLHSALLVADCLPRLLVVLLHEEPLREYRGFHHAGVALNVPPLTQPIKPRFRKKGLALLNKFIHARRDEPEEERKSVSLGSLKHKFRLSLISLLHHSDTLRHTLTLEAPAFDLNLDQHELQEILKPRRPLMPAHTLASDVIPEHPHKNSAWKAPDSWDVTETPAALPGVEGFFEVAVLPQPLAELSRSSARSYDEAPFPERGLPLLFGTASARADKPAGKGPNHIVRVFKEDNTFTTILCPLETSTAELLTIVQRKFFFESISNYQILLYVGNSVKILEPFEKPLKIQMGLLKLSGYTDSDKLNIIGREDLSSVCKFVVEHMFLRNLTHEEELVLLRDYVDVNILGLHLKTVPIIFHQHTYEIEKLNAANNPLIHIPLDFIQLCTNLRSINFARNGCLKFPVNFLEARGLTHLNMEGNFLDELPVLFGGLVHLENVRLNLNQLYCLPKQLAKLTNLTSLNLSSNYFQHYPECISDLANLQDLDLSYNDLLAIPDLIARLQKLTKLNLSTNKLSGMLPLCFKALTSLKRLDFRYNMITNVDVLGSLPNLEVVYASKNAISAFSDKMESLRLLHFDRNPITSLEFEMLLPILTVLDLLRAKILAVPVEFVGKIPNVEKLVLDKNHLVNLPDELGQLPKLTYLSLYGNNIQHLPPLIGQLTLLQYLDVHLNNLESLPAEIWNLASLSVLNVASNLLQSFPQPSFAVAKKISSTANLQEIAAKNNLAPSITPTSLADSLLSLTLSDNRLTDECFEALLILINLKTLNLSYNDIIEVPDGALSRLNKLTDLYLSGNGLTTLPAEDLEMLTELRLLFVNNNKLSMLPPELAKVKNLVHFDVGLNELRYNVSNWPYDWNWCWNQKLRYLNFSGNRRFEIKQTYVKNPETGEDFDSLLVLKHLRVLGLIDVTLTTPSVPDSSVDNRIRTTSSELTNVGYGVSDTMGVREHVSFRDTFIQKFRGNEDEVLMCLVDGKVAHKHDKGHLVSLLAKNLFVAHFSAELAKDEAPADALRRAFLFLNRDINSVFAAKKSGILPTTTPELAQLELADTLTGCALAVVYLKGNTIYCANVGDTEIVVSKNTGQYQLLTTKHDPTSRREFERIRASGGYVSADGALDSTLHVSRGVGFFDFLPHTHSGPSIRTYELSGAEDVIVLGTKGLWDFVSYNLAVDISRQEKDDPMIAAQKLRDYAICYGGSDKISVTVISIGDQKKKKKGLYNNLLRDHDGFARKRQNRGTGDTALRRLDDEIDPPVGDLALVFTDIKNLTLLWDTYPVAMRSAIKLHNTIMRRQLRIVGGYEVKTEGDSFMVSFPSPTLALLWCFNVQNQLLQEEWPSEILETEECCEVTDSKGNLIFRGLSVRMGIHWGSPVSELDMVTRRMDYFGPMVNRTLRINSSADGGQIAVSTDFLHELELLFKTHEQIKSGETSLAAAYEANPRAGEIIEREISALEDIGTSFFELGERKLKGLETPEMITLAFPKKLDIRFEIFKERMNEDATPARRIAGAIPVDLLIHLRTIALKLENLCSVLNVGPSRDNATFSPMALLTRESTLHAMELDLVGFLNHFVVRVENCVAHLELRQTMLRVAGDGRIGHTDGRHVWELLDEMRLLLLGKAVDV